MATIRLLRAMSMDAVRGWLGLAPAYIRVVGLPGELAMIASREAQQTIDRMQSSYWRNEVAPRALFEMMRYKPSTLAGQVEMPVLVCIAERDRESPVSRVDRSGVERPNPALQPKLTLGVKRADAMNLHNGAVRTISVHRAAGRRERIIAGFQFFERGAVPCVAGGEIPRALHDGDVLVDRMFVQGDDRAGELIDAHHERLARFFGIAIENLDVSRHRAQRNDAMRAIARRGGVRYAGRSIERARRRRMMAAGDREHQCAERECESHGSPSLRDRRGTFG